MAKPSHFRLKAPSPTHNLRGNTMLRSFLAALFVSAAIISPVSAADAFTATQRAEMNAAIKQFIIDNPQALISSVESYYNKQNKEKEAQEGPIKTFPAGLL